MSALGFEWHNFQLNRQSTLQNRGSGDSDLYFALNINLDDPGSPDITKKLYQGLCLLEVGN